MATKYYGWEHVPEGILVRSRSKGKVTGVKGDYEFYVKLHDGFQFKYNEGSFVDSVTEWNPDEFTTGVYKALQ